MNEIELLQRLRAGLPAARPENRAAARVALMASVERSQRSARSSAPLWRRSWLRLAAAASLAILLIAVPVAIFGGSGKVQPAVAQILRKTAEVAATRKPLYPSRGQYLYTRSKSAYLSSVGKWSVLVPGENETWVSFDDALRGRTRTVSGKPRFVSAAQRAGWVAAGSPRLSPPGRVEDSAVSGSSVLPDPVEASGLPTEPATLRKMIEAREIRGLEGPPGEAETFTLIGDMLRQAYLPAALRATIYRLTAELPGVELLGEVEDPAGRAGIGIAFTDPRRGTRHELIFDPATSALLGERESIARAGAYGFKASPGTVVGYAAYLESKVVDSVGGNPPAGAGGLDRSVGCYDRASRHAGAAILHGQDPIAVCAKLWREGVVGDGRFSPHLVACAFKGSSAAHVLPAPGPAVCRHLGLVPWQGW